MALATSALRSAIVTLLTTIKNWDGTTGKDRDDAINKIATDLSSAIETHIKSALVNCSIPSGSVIIQVTGGSGSPAVGVPNPTPISLTGDPTAPAGTNNAGGLS